MKFRSSKISSEARVHLAELIEARAEARAEVADAEARVVRLSALATAADKPRSALARLDAEEAQQFAEWSRNPDAPPPVADSAARTDLQGEIAEAQSSADAAARAVDQVRQDVLAAHGKLTTAKSAIKLAAGRVAIEELAPIAEAARAAVAALAEARTKGKALSQVLAAVVEYGAASPDAREYAKVYAAAGDAFRNAFAMPLPSEAAEAAHIAAANRLLFALNGDAGAKMEAA